MRRRRGPSSWRRWPSGAPWHRLFGSLASWSRWIAGVGGVAGAAPPPLSPGGVELTTSLQGFTPAPAGTFNGPVSTSTLLTYTTDPDVLGRDRGRLGQRLSPHVVSAVCRHRRHHRRPGRRVPRPRRHHRFPRRPPGGAQHAVHGHHVPVSRRAAPRAIRPRRDRAELDRRRRLLGSWRLRHVRHGGDAGGDCVALADRAGGGGAMGPASRWWVPGWCVGGAGRSADQGSRRCCRRRTSRARVPGASRRYWSW